MSIIVSEQQQLRFPEPKVLECVQEQLSSFSALINYREISMLKKYLKKAASREVFIIQAGDCAERFSDAELSITRRKYELLVKLKELAESMLQIQAIAIGRIAGQYAKPRSKLTEIISEKSIYAYHGDMINAEQATIESRTPEPNRLIQAYNASKKVLSHLNKFDKFIFSSHECFLLEYEKPLTRKCNKSLYNLSTHLPWLGMRNVKSENHINYLSTIENPIAIKLGPETSIQWLELLLNRLNYKNEVGKIILITRLGSDNAEKILPNIIKKILQKNYNVIWMCDPLHGNTQTDKYGKKFRLMPKILQETIATIDILHSNNCFLSGVHLEASPSNDILECVNSSEELVENRLYESALDPRLNSAQSIFYLQEILKKLR